ncbi:major facilitator superfamily domain-containing protein [Apiosordaria backusii]|uniref:Major facilitator superfamily domain-containing protein n=1 Tax=Apiosordaria backusii TaxID=314023 RepID=A0AA40AAE5_9PEZI|nr:major facilitator superfamily domain-containing protein [Apiosordaria backusii]
MASFHPVITSHFHSANSASWLSISFLLTQTSFQPLVGGLSDAIGRKVPYVILTGVFALGTLWCALAGSMRQFILARAVCGLGAGGMMTLGSIIMSDVVPIEIRPKYQSLLNVTFGVGSMMGAGMGGVDGGLSGVEVGVWGASSCAGDVCVGVSGLVIPGDLGLYGRERVTVRQALREFDFWGGGDHPIVVGSLAFFAVVFPVFLWVEGWVKKPIMPLHLVFQSPHMNLMVSSHISALLAAAILFNVPLFFQGVLLTSATESGLRLVTCSAVQALCGMTTGFLITWSRRMKWPLITGATLVIAGLFCLFSMERGWPTWLYMLCLIPASAGLGFQFPGSFMAVLAASEQHEQAVVTSTLMLWRSTGTILGVACSSLVVQNSLWYYLEEFVSGTEKDAVIGKVRKSVEAIRELEGVYQEQVVQSYAAALRLTFLCCFILAVVNLCLVAPVRLGRLGSKK